MYKFRILLMAFLAANITLSYAQKSQLKFEQLGINEGLSQSTVRCIFQDSRGFMWFGTRDGLNKYDGYKFTVYKNDAKDSTSISNNFITGIVEDAKGIIWIATRGGGLNRYDKEKNRFTHFKNDPKNPGSISNNLLTGISKDAEGNLWICTEGDLNSLSTGSNKFLHYNIDA